MDTRRYRLRHTTAGMAGALALTMAAAACSSSGGTSSGASGGGTIIMTQFGQNSSLDPALQTVASFTDGPPMAAIYGSLAYADPATGKTVMNFADSITASQGGKVWTIKLHPGMKFSDGTAFDATAVDFNIKRDADPSLHSAFAAVASTLQTKVVDATSLEITLPAVDTGFDKVIVQDFPFIASPTAVKSKGAAFKTSPVGAGPFMMKQWLVGTSMKMVRNPNYALFKKGQPYAENLQINNVPSTSQEVTALSNGNAQLAWVQGGQFIQQMEKAGVNVAKSTSGGGAAIDLNNSIAPFNDPVARRAVAFALPSAGLADAWLPGTPPATNLFATSSPFYDKKFDLPAADPVQAQKLFDQLKAEGKPLSFTFIVPVGFPALGPYVQSQLARFKNVTVKIQSALTAQYVTAWHGGTYQMTIGNLYWNDPVPLAILNLAKGGSINYPKWNNAAVNAALADVQKTTDPAQQKKDWDIVQQEFINDRPLLLAQQGTFGVAYSKQVTGVAGMEYGTIPLWDQIKVK
jgi:ABC-type transport system substrate-binding protein